MKEKLVSIIIPTFNNAQHIDQLIHNIRLYTYKNIEIIIGDDCSTDNTSSVLSKYSQDPSIQLLISEVNLGPGAMRNRLISIAKGDYIAIQDADDLSDSTRIEKQVNILNSNKNISVVGTHCKLKFNNKTWGEINPPQTPSIKNWLLQNSIVHATIMFRKEVFDKCKYHEQLRLGEDYFFLTKIYSQGIQFFNITEPLYTYIVEKNDLQTRNFRHFTKVLKAKIYISSLFKGPTKALFLFISLAKHFVSTSICLVRYIFS